jgi:hypothetical protein
MSGGMGLAGCPICADQGFEKCFCGPRDWYVVRPRYLGTPRKVRYSNLVIVR